MRERKGTRIKPNTHRVVDLHPYWGKRSQMGEKKLPMGMVAIPGCLILSGQMHLKPKSQFAFVLPQTSIPLLHWTHALLCTHLHTQLLPQQGCLSSSCFCCSLFPASFLRAQESIFHPKTSQCGHLKVQRVQGASQPFIQLVNEGSLLGW